MNETLIYVIEREIKMAQREALKEVFNSYMEKTRRYDKLLNSKEYDTLAKMAFGERFTRLQQTWFKAFEKSQFYLEVAIEISKAMNKYC